MKLTIEKAGYKQKKLSVAGKAKVRYFLKLDFVREIEHATGIIIKPNSLESVALNSFCTEVVIKDTEKSLDHSEYGFYSTPTTFRHASGLGEPSPLAAGDVYTLAHPLYNVLNEGLIVAKGSLSEVNVQLAKLRRVEISKFRESIAKAVMFATVQSEYEKAERQMVMYEEALTDLDFIANNGFDDYKRKVK